MADQKRLVHTTIATGILLGMFFAGCWVTADAWTRRTIAEREERKTTARMALLMDNMGEGVFDLDGAGLCTFINTAALAILGYREHEVVGRDAHELFHRDAWNLWPEDHRCPIVQAAVSGRSWTGEDHFIRRDGTPVPVQVCATPIRGGGVVIGVVVVFQDSSERRRLEDRARQAQKLEAIGTLAGGVAHDFNNILTTISGHAHLLAISMPEGDPMREDVDKIVETGERARSVVQRLVAFSRRQAMWTAPLELNAFIEGHASKIRKLVGDRISLGLHLTAEQLKVLADGSQLELVLMNIISNAADAMPQGGSIVISTERLAGSAPGASQAGMPEQGTFAQLVVQDTGAGMDDGTRQRIFDPFFTTKDVDEGAGLGLAMVYGIIEQLHGAVDVQSELGRGTSVSIFLPLLSEGPGAA